MSSFSAAPAAPLCEYEEQREESVRHNMDELVRLGLLPDPATFVPPPPPPPRILTKDKVVPRDKSNRQAQPPKRFEDEFEEMYGVELDVGELADSLLGSDGTTCFCGKADDDETGRYILCNKCGRFCHPTCAGVAFDDGGSTLPAYQCPSCQISNSLLPPRLKRSKNLPNSPALAPIKPLATSSLSVRNGMVNFTVYATPDFPRAFPVDQQLSKSVATCIRRANMHIQPRLDLANVDPNQVTCINKPCDGTIKRLGGGTVTPRGSKYRYACRLCGQRWQQLPPSKCPDGNFEISTTLYATKNSATKSKRKCSENFCKTCKLPKKGHKNGYDCIAPSSLPLPFPHPLLPLDQSFLEPLPDLSDHDLGMYDRD